MSEIEINKLKKNEVLLFKPQSAQQPTQLHLPSLSISANNSNIINSENVSQPSVRTNEKNYSEEQLERMKLCGTLFNRKASIKKEIINEFFRREPCLYKQIVYKNAARIFHCLKADLNENPILKSLKQQKLKESGESEANEKQVTEVPKIDYENNQEKRNTLQLAFSTLKFQKVLEDLLDMCQFYGNHPEYKDEQSLVCTILFDYMMRKFQLRDKLIEEPFDNQDPLVTQIETTIHNEKTDLAAELAKNRIREDALTLEDLLPAELREVDQHKAELPLYCWINNLKTTQEELISTLIQDEELKLVDSKSNLDRKCFMIDPHCPNVLMFHYALRNKILNHEFVKSSKLIIQDKSSCLAPYSVVKLLSKKDDVIITNPSGGLVAAYIGCMMEEFEGKVYIYGEMNDDKYQELSNKFQKIGCAKYVKIVREDFLTLQADDPKLDTVKVILINAPCTKSALMSPMEFLFQEGEDVKFLRDYTLDVNNPNRLKKCIQNELLVLKHALKFNKVRAIVYQTYSKHSNENEGLVNKCLSEFIETRPKNVFPYKISPPIILLTAEDIKNEEVMKDSKFLKFKPSTKMNGCFIALLTRDKDGTVDKEARKAEALIEKKAKSKLSAPEYATFQEKNFLVKPTDKKSSMVKAPSKRLTNIRRKSLGDTAAIVSSKSSSTINGKSSTAAIYNSLEKEIRQLELKNQINKSDALISAINTNSNNNHQDTNESIKSKILITNNNNNSNSNNQLEPMNFKKRVHSFENRLAQIGKLEKKLDMPIPNRSSTPDEKASPTNLIRLNKSKNNFIKMNIENASKIRVKSAKHNYLMSFNRKNKDDTDQVNNNYRDIKVNFDEKIYNKDVGKNVTPNNSSNNSFIDDILPLNCNPSTARSYINLDQRDLFLVEPSEKNIKINNDFSDCNNFEKSFSILTSKIKKEQEEENLKLLFSRQTSTKNLSASNIKSTFKSVSFLDNFNHQSKNKRENLFKAIDLTSQSFTLPKRILSSNSHLNQSPRASSSASIKNPKANSALQLDQSNRPKSYTYKEIKFDFYVKSDFRLNANSKTQSYKTTKSSPLIIPVRPKNGEFVSAYF